MLHGHHCVHLTVRTIQTVLTFRRVKIHEIKLLVAVGGGLFPALVVWPLTSCSLLDADTQLPSQGLHILILGRPETTVPNINIFKL